MGIKGLFSLHNELSTEGADRVRLELNPAVVAEGTQRRYGLSTVCLGPSLGTPEEAVELTLDCDGESVRLESVGHRSEACEDGVWLTVALFDTPVELLRRLATGSRIEIGIGSGESRLVRPFDGANRLNLIRFLGHPDVAKPAPIDDREAIESVAV